MVVTLILSSVTTVSSSRTVLTNIMMFKLYFLVLMCFVITLSNVYSSLLF